MSTERTFLFVDDVELFRDLGSRFLSRSGRVVTARSGEECLEVARRVRPDVIFVDLLMPGLEGDDVCRLVKADPKLRDTPVILLVGAETPGHWGRAVRAGADDVLAKPISSVSLCQSARRFLGGRVPSGLPRIPLNSAVQLQLGTRFHQGRLKNLSRGGLFVETGCQLWEDREVGLQFVLPESATQFNPTAQVVWKQPGGATQDAGGLGMRFVDISSDLVRKLEDYVFDRAFDSFSTVAGATR